MRKTPVVGDCCSTQRLVTLSALLKEKEKEDMIPVFFPESGRLENIHTGKKLDIVAIDMVPNVIDSSNYPSSVKVWILSDGSRWNAENITNWKPIVAERQVPVTKTEAEKFVRDEYSYDERWITEMLKVLDYIYGKDS